MTAASPPNGNKIARSQYPPAQPGALGSRPFEAPVGVADAAPYALAPSIRLGRCTLRIKRSATGQSCASPPVNRMAISRPLASASAWIFVLRPPRERPAACFSPLFSAGCRAVGLHMWSRSSAYLWIALSQQARGIAVPQCRAEPSEQTGYRSWSGDHIRAGNRTSGNRFSTHARYR